MPVLILAADNPIFAGLLAILLLAGISLLALVVGHLVPNWSIPGLGNIRSAVVNAAGAALRAVTGWLDAAVGPVASFVLAPYHLLNHLIGAVQDVASATWHALVRAKAFALHLYRTAIAHVDRAVAGVRRYALGLYHQAVELVLRVEARLVNYALGLYHQAVELALRVEARLVNYALGLYHQAVELALRVEAAAVREARDLYHRAVDYAARGLAEARVYTDAAVGAAVGWAARELASLRRYTDAAIAASVAVVTGVITTDIVTPVEKVWVDVRDDAAAIEGILATDLPDIRALLREIDLADVTSIAGALAGVAAVEKVMTRYLRDCGIPQCKALHGLTKDLPDLLALAEGAGFLAFLAAMVRDPDGTARETFDVLDGLVSGTVHTVADVLGV